MKTKTEGEKKAENQNNPINRAAGEISANEVNSENRGLRNSCQNSSQASLIFENRIEREWLSTQEAAHYLRISSNALTIMVCRGQIKFSKFGRRLRFRLEDCEALFNMEGA